MMPARAPQPRPRKKTFDQARADRDRSSAPFHHRNLVAAVHHLRNIDIFQVLGEALVQNFQAIDLPFDAIEQGETLAQVERLGFPFLDVRLQILHLFTDGFAARLESFHGIRAKQVDQFFLLNNFVVQFDDLGMLGLQVTRQRVALRLQ